MSRQRLISCNRATGGLSALRRGFWALALATALVPASAMAPAAAPASSAPLKLVDINSASKTELKSLPGIGDSEADSIIRHRPYLTKTELVTKKVLPAGPFLSLKSKIVAMQPQAKKTGLTR